MSQKSGLPWKTVKAKNTHSNLRGDDIQVHPANLGPLFAKRPLVLGEDEAEYDELLIRVTAAIRPCGIIESMWVKDVVDLMWEAQRLRRLKAELLKQAGRRALEEFLRSQPSAGLINGIQYSIPSLVASYAAGAKEAVTEVERILAQNGLDADTLMARALTNKLDEVERLERMLAGIDARRNRVLGEIERRRETLARQTRLVAEDVVDIS